MGILTEFAIVSLSLGLLDNGIHWDLVKAEWKLMMSDDSTDL